MNLCELDLKEFKKNYEYSDLCMLEYIRDFIISSSNNYLNELYIDVCNYNEIYANGWTIKDLLEMGKNDKYWIERANNFITKYNVPKDDYNEYLKYFDRYIELRNNLLDELGIDDRYLNSDIKIEEIPRYGFYECEIITSPKDFQKEYSYTVARVRNFGHCVELHYYNGKATVEYGDKITSDYWESVVEGAEWFNDTMSDIEIINKLDELFEEYYGVKYEK